MLTTTYYFLLTTISTASPTEAEAIPPPPHHRGGGIPWHASFLHSLPTLWLAFTNSIQNQTTPHHTTGGGEDQDLKPGTYILLYYVFTDVQVWHTSLFTLHIFRLSLSLGRPGWSARVALNAAVSAMSNAWPQSLELLRLLEVCLIFCRSHLFGHGPPNSPNATCDALVLPHQESSAKPC